MVKTVVIVCNKIDDYGEIKSCEIYATILNIDQDEFIYKNIKYKTIKSLTNGYKKAIQHDYFWKFPEPPIPSCGWPPSYSLISFKLIETKFYNGHIALRYNNKWKWCYKHRMLAWSVKYNKMIFTEKKFSSNFNDLIKYEKRTEDNLHEIAYNLKYKKIKKIIKNKSYFYFNDENIFSVSGKIIDKLLIEDFIFIYHQMLDIKITEEDRELFSQL
jgi:hypothetical protein